MNRINRIFENSLSCKSLFISPSMLNGYQGNDDFFPIIVLRTKEDILSQLR
jgi:hypothetical protein